MRAERGGLQPYGSADRTLRLTAEYLSKDFGGVLLGYGNKPGEVLNDASPLERAATFFAQAPIRLAAQ